VRQNGTNQNQIVVSWSSVAGATSYHVYKDGTRVRTGETGLSVTLGNIEPDRLYKVSIRAVNSVGQSGLSQFTNYRRKPRAVISTLFVTWLDKHKREIDSRPDAAAITPILNRMNFDIDSRTYFTTSSLRAHNSDGIRIINAPIVVLAGHGESDKVQVNSGPNTHWFYSSDIPDMSRSRLVVLMSCEGALGGTNSIASRFVQQGAVASIGFQAEIDGGRENNSPTATFAGALFQSLEENPNGRTIHRAAQDAQYAVELDFDDPEKYEPMATWRIFGNQFSLPFINFG
jgi:hypothetical protein